MEKINEPKPFLDDVSCNKELYISKEVREKSVGKRKCRKSTCMKQTTFHLSKILNIMAKITFAQSKLRTVHSMIYPLEKPKVIGNSRI